MLEIARVGHNMATSSDVPPGTAAEDAKGLRWLRMVGLLLAATFVFSLGGAVVTMQSSPDSSNARRNGSSISLGEQER